jgi:hypothetical protein
MDTILNYWPILVLGVAGTSLVLAFCIVYLFRTFALSRKIRQFTGRLEPLRNQEAAPRQIDLSKWQP